jgi:hypothetical protein
MFKFYIKKPGEDWEEIPEEAFHHRLYIFMRQTTPVIRLLLKGEEYVLPSGDTVKLEKQCLDM